MICDMVQAKDQANKSAMSKDKHVEKQAVSHNVQKDNHL